MEEPDENVRLQESPYAVFKPVEKSKGFLSSARDFVRKLGRKSVQRNPGVTSSSSSPQTLTDSDYVSTDVEYETPPEEVQLTPGTTVKGLYDFAAKEPGDLTFKKGELLYIIEYLSKHRCIATNKIGNQGYIPCNYVKQVPLPPGTKVKGLYDFAAKEPDELAFKKDELLCIIELSTSNWWKAVNEIGNQGYIPRNYVKQVPLQPGTIVKGLYHFAAEEPEELAFKKDELLCIIELSSKGWCIAENGNGNQGCIPCNYVKQVLQRQGGFEVMGMCEFRGRTPKDLPFRKDEVLYIESESSAQQKSIALLMLMCCQQALVFA